MRPYRPASHTMTMWAAKQDSTNQLDGRWTTLCLWWWKRPRVVHGNVLQLFKTRSECRAWIEEEYGYLRHRPDLKVEPHCWRIPYAVKVTVEIMECPKLIRTCTPASGTGPTRKRRRMGLILRKRQRSAT